MISGIDRFNENVSGILKNRNFALITGSANVDSKGNPVYLTMKRNAGTHLKAIWSLQHGFFIDKQDNMIFSNSFSWKELDIEIKSLYGENLLPQPEWLEDIDALVIDILDVGTRVYTFVNHMVMVMKYLSGKGIDVVVLDRPNPLGGTALEGNIMEPDYFSIVGQLPVPMRHGLTVGEYLSYALSYYSIDLKLEIVRVKGWKRNQGFAGIWTYPSPNMPAYQTAVVYPGSVMLEGTNLSEGRGTTRPFEFVGAPFVNHMVLADELRTIAGDHTVYVPVFFKPEFSKYRGEVCRGVLVHPTDFEGFGSFKVFYEIIRWIYHRYPDQFQWKKPPYEFEYERLPIDMINGSPMIREGIEANLRFEELEETFAATQNIYTENIQDYLLY